MSKTQKIRDVISKLNRGVEEKLEYTWWEKRKGALWRLPTAVLLFILFLLPSFILGFIWEQVCIGWKEGRGQGSFENGGFWGYEPPK